MWVTTRDPCPHPQPLFCHRRCYEGTAQHHLEPAHSHSFSCNGSKFTEQAVTGGHRGLKKPDLVILNIATKRAVVVDVAIAFNLPQNMECCHRFRPPTKQHHKGGEVRPPHTCAPQPRLHGCVGATRMCRGYTDVSYEEVLKRCVIHWNCTPLFHKLCCLDAIAGSHLVWKARCTRC